MKIIKESGKIIRVLRKRGKVTQSELSDLVGKSRSYISRVERNKKKIEEDELEKLLKALKIKVTEYDSLVKTQELLNDWSEKTVSVKRNILNKTKKAVQTQKHKSRRELIELMKQYFQDKPVKEVYLFGSVARQEHAGNSDIDLLIEFKENHKTTLFDLIEIKNDLKDITGYNIDLVQKGTEYSHVREGIEKDKIEIYG